jgi:hypothetical protein
MTPALTKPSHNLPLLVCIACAVLPFVAVQLTYLIAASHGLVDWCFPYTDSCTSISATGRRPPASYLFRAMMLPSAAFMMVFWWLHWFWLATLDARARTRHSMLVLGVVACLGLIAYVTVLGEIGSVWRLQRKIGTVLFFSFTFLAQLLLAAMLRRYGREASTRATGERILRLCQIMLLIGVMSVLMEVFYEAVHDSFEDAIEWQLALLLQLNFFFCTRLWWRSNWRLEFTGQTTR